MISNLTDVLAGTTATVLIFVAQNAKVSTCVVEEIAFQEGEYMNIYDDTIETSWLDEAFEEFKKESLPTSN